jgi:hypothetical protein
MPKTGGINVTEIQHFSLVFWVYYGRMEYVAGALVLCIAGLMLVLAFGEDY